MSSDWRTPFDRAGVLHLNAGNSDHYHILVCSVLDHPSRPKLFRFIEAWTMDLSYEQVIKKAWVHYDMRKGRVSFANQIRNTARALKDWNKNTFDICQTRVADLEDQLRVV